MDIGILAIIIGVIVAVYNFVTSTRKNKKNKKQGGNSVFIHLGKSLLLGLLAYVVVVNINLDTEESPAVDYEVGESVVVENQTTDETEQEKEQIEYAFRNEELLMDHYEKHEIEMRYKSAEKYLKGANRVIQDEDTLHAVEKEDGDDVYYLEKTNEFVVVSKDGYIRTYFCPEDGIEYFHRQYE